MPSNISLSTNFNRLYNKQRFRNVDQIDDAIPLPDLYKRNYTFDWQYTLSHNITKKLQFNFSATRNNIVRNYVDNPLAIEPVIDQTNTVLGWFL